MKITLTILCMIMFHYHVLAQTFSRTIISCDKSYNISSHLQSDNFLVVRITHVENSDTSYREFSTKTTDMEIFAKVFQQELLLFINDTTACSTTQSEEIMGIGRNIFLAIIAANTSDLTPLAGILHLEDTVTCVNIDTSLHDQRDVKTKGKVLKMKFEINNDYLENLKVYVLINNKLYYFTNDYGIGISNLKNIKSFPKTFLFSLPNSTGLNYKISLANILSYDYEIASNRRDYSPQDISTEVAGGQEIKLFKDATNKLFEAQIYTDFLGLSNNRPNGLIQTEISKNINISTVQKAIPKPFDLIAHSVGSFQYASPNATLSKIEQHNKYLVLNDLDSLRANPGIIDTARLKTTKHRFATPLNLYQYQTFSAGMDINVITLSNHDLKYNFYLNIGAKLGITSVTDSLTNIKQGIIKKTGFVSNFSITTLQWYPSITTSFFPEERFSFTFSEKFIHLKAYNNYTELLSFNTKNSKILTTNTHSWLNILEMLITIKVNSESKLFGRIRYNYELKNVDNNFAQVQVGYSTYILGRR